MGTIEKLPRNMMEEIMLRTRPESLIRFKLVSKSWYELIKSLVQDPKFAAKNLEKTKTASSSTSLAFLDDGGRCNCQKPELMLKHLPHDLILELPHSRSCARKPPYLLTVFHGDGDGDGDGENGYNFRRVTEDFPLPRLLGDIYSSSAWQYHCDGIVCFFRHDGENSVISCFLCNPTIKELRALPKPILFSHLMMRGGGLLYDSTSDDYKLVVIGLDPFGQPKAEMYSLNNDCWKEISFDWRDLLVDCGEDDDWFVVSEILYRGALYWSIHRNRPPNFCLILFDVAAELFRSLPVPSDIPCDWNPKDLTVWNESVALINYCEGDCVEPIQIWVMYGQSFPGGVRGSCSWIKRLIIDHLPGIRYPLTFWNGDELLMVCNRNLISYNVRSQKIRILAYGVDSLAFNYIYVKSLVSLLRRR